MGDYLRYSLFDKYFKMMGCTSPQGAVGQGYDSDHYLISWYYAWGGPIENQNWAFRIGCSHVHQGYQNPMAAWILSQQQAFKPRSENGARDWGKSLERQLEFYRWLAGLAGKLQAVCRTTEARGIRHHGWEWKGGRLHQQHGELQRIRRAAHDCQPDDQGTAGLLAAMPV